ncbi:MAG: Rpn family recombination-promoting nuclease/putative transposase [Treponema sp.]|nr:Rpn family recombination-promoting nuclease/putative transposase [Treponema sp.]MDY3756191.1 Rpn family recombination-promoting nuclease/putative transposase [Treponema sp.]MDY4674823.1 Rpn family recombination-promoting nuclease/putative transposase [Treponema sp.]
MKPIEELTFTDDYMFGYVMRNEEICKGLLERLLGIKIKRLEFPTLQKTIAPHYESKGVRLDVYVQDSSRVFDIEIQNSLHDDLPTRTRYYQSMMDIDLLLKGKQYSELKESFVIFVCQEDFFEENLPCYTFSNLCHEKLTLELGDKTHKIIFNASAFHQEKDVERKSILEYIKNKKSTSDFTQKIHQIVERTKENQAFRGEYMAWGLAEQDAEKRGYKAGVTDGISQGIMQGITKGAEQAKIETAQNLLAMGLSLDNIAKATGLSLETLKKLATGENPTQQMTTS